MPFSKKTMNILSIVNGLFSQIAMTFSSNILTSIISLFLIELHSKDINVSVEKFTAMDFFGKKAFSSISNLYIPTSIIGGLFIRYFGMKKIQIITFICQGIVLVLLIYLKEKANIIFYSIAWFVFFFGIGAVSQISLRNSALHFRRYQGTVAISLLIFGDIVITILGWIFQDKFPTNANRTYDELIISIFLYFIPMWISLFIIFFVDFEKDSLDNTQQDKLTFKEYWEELKELYKYEGLAKTMLIEFLITILSYILVQINYNYSDYFSKTSNHCPMLKKNYIDISTYRNIFWIGCIVFAFLLDKEFNFEKMVRFINITGGILGLLLLVCSLKIKEKTSSFLITQCIFLPKYFLICGFYSVILVKTLKIFSPTKMMEMTGFIGIAPAITKIIRLLFEEFFGYLLTTEDIKKEIIELCDKINYEDSYNIFGAWIYYKLLYSKYFYIVFGIFTIILNIIAVYYVQNVPQIEIPFDVAAPGELKQKIETVKTQEIQYVISEDEED